MSRDTCARCPATTHRCPRGDTVHSHTAEVGVIGIRASSRTTREPSIVDGPATPAGSGFVGRSRQARSPRRAPPCIGRLSGHRCGCCPGRGRAPGAGVNCRRSVVAGRALSAALATRTAGRVRSGPGYYSSRRDGRVAPVGGGGCVRSGAGALTRPPPEAAGDVGGHRCRRLRPLPEHEQHRGRHQDGQRRRHHRHRCRWLVLRAPVVRAAGQRPWGCGWVSEATRHMRVRLPAPGQLRPNSRILR